MPVNIDAVDLRTLIRSPFNYWVDDDGDGDITATDTLNLSIVDKVNQKLSGNTVPKICQASYQVKSKFHGGKLTIRYGVSESRNFSICDVTYYVNPKSPPIICFARPNLQYGAGGYEDPALMWDTDPLSGGFIPLSFFSSSYNLNFPITGAHDLYFDLNVRSI